MVRRVSDSSVGRPPGLRCIAPLETINTLMEELIPGSTTVDMEYDVPMIELADMNVNMEGKLKVPMISTVSTMKTRKTLKPKVHSTLPPPREATFRQCLLALIKRNMGVSSVASPMNYGEFAAESFDQMMDTFGVADWRQRLAAMEEIVPNEASMTAWENMQNPSTIAAMQRMDPAFIAQQAAEDIDNYEFILKAAPKASTESKPVHVFATVQTVMFHKKTVNAFYGPMVREADKRFRLLLRPEVIYNKGRSLDNVETHLDLHCVESKAAVCFEADLENFDRQQQEVASNLDEVLLTRMKMRPDVVELWMRGHNVHSNYNFKLGLKVWLLYQRKSGDVTTSFGNSVLNMTAIVHGLKLKREEVICGMFLGDDSWLQLWRNETLYNRMRGSSERIAIHFNGEVKTATFDVGYFCGNYILRTTAGIRLAADPVRRAVKLGRWDVKSTGMLGENWISFKDLLRNYEDEEVQEKLAEAVVERMPKATYGTVKMLVEALHSLKLSFKEFKNLYDDETTVTVY